MDYQYGYEEETGINGNLVLSKNDEDMVKNEDVLEKVRQQRQMIKRITERQLRFLGHIVREDNLEELVLEGKIDGSRSRGQQRKKYLDNLALAAGNIRKGELLHLAQDRTRFRIMVANVSS